MNNNTKGLIVAGISLGLLGLGYFLVYKKGKSGNKNFTSLQDNLGLTANNENVVIAPFNDKKNTAQFYTNDRVVVFNSDKNVVVKGSYSDGGKTIKLDNGKEITSGSVWENLLKTVK